MTVHFYAEYSADLKEMHCHKQMVKVGINESAEIVSQTIDYISGIISPTDVE